MKTGGPSPCGPLAYLGGRHAFWGPQIQPPNRGKIINMTEKLVILMSSMVIAAAQV